jgi:L-asparaginase II
VDYDAILEITRGDLVESIHYGALAIADNTGRLIASWGSPHLVTFLRSSAKPFQALPFVESGAAERYGLSAKELAVICASHSGAENHVETVVSVQSKVGIREDQLQCGVHPPYDPDAASHLAASGAQPTPNHNNCSGKHSGMLAFARFLGEPLESYLDPDHAVQRKILDVLSEMSGEDRDRIGLGIDGCSAPNFALTLGAAATAFARLADPSGLAPSRAKACRQITEAMMSHPEMVGGVGRLDTDLMRAASGRLVSKGGAEGYQGLALLPGSIRSGSPALGIAIKISDGDLGKRASRLVVLAVLRQLGAIRPEEFAALGGDELQRVTNRRGLNVGEARTSLSLALAI